MNEITHWDDIGMSAVTCSDEYEMSFKLHTHMSQDIWQSGKKIADRDFLRKNGNGNSFDTVIDINDAEVFMSGYIKWDGCANLRFDEQDRGLIHICGEENFEDIAEAVHRLYELARTTITNACLEKG